jgi:hypothetical protein
MADNLQNRGEPDRSRINVNEEHEVHYWTQLLGVTPDELRDAARNVGTSAEAIRAHLARRR